MIVTSCGESSRAFCGSCCCSIYLLRLGTPALLRSWAADACGGLDLERSIAIAGAIECEESADTGLDGFGGLSRSRQIAWDKHRPCLQRAYDQIAEILGCYRGIGDCE